jgi:hypothetical protein
MLRSAVAVFTIFATSTLGFAQSQIHGQAEVRSNPTVTDAVQYGLSAPVRHMPLTLSGEGTFQEIPLHRPPIPARPLQLLRDPVLQESTGTLAVLPPDINILGIGMGFQNYVDRAVPPDPNGAVGDTQFVQWVNLDFAIFAKGDGSLIYGPVPGNTLWQSALPGSPCAAHNSGDPIAQFDKQAKRWVLMQPVFVYPFALCVAISTSSDATGSYYAYEFPIPGNYFPDYPKLAIWPDGYYVSYDQFNGNTFVAAAACALDRAYMLAGTPATMQCFDTTGASILPSDLDGASGASGTTLPPPSGAPNYFIGLGTASLNLWQFSVDWVNPANSTLVGPVSVQGVAPFNPACPGAIGCIPALGGFPLDALGDRVMYRLSYRDFGSYESLLVNHSVDTGSGNIGIRWYEIRSPGSTPTVYQQGTHSPDTANYRWMGSIAQDKAGNIAVGYSISSPFVYPAINYAGREFSDPLGTMGSETSIIPGLGSQTNTARWGDYTSLVVDPNDDCSFWYTNEYLLRTGGPNAWSTRIASFRFPSCGPADFALSASPAAQTISAGNGTSYTVTVTALAGFNGSVTLNVGGLPAGATGTFSTNPATATSTLTVTTSAATPAGIYPLTIGGVSGALMHTTTVQLLVTGFVLAASPTSQTVSVGGSATYNITVTPVGGFAGSVNLSLSGLPPRANYNFTPDPTSGASSLVIKTNKNAPPGIYGLTISGKGGKLTNTAQIGLTIQ